MFQYCEQVSWSNYMTQQTCVVSLLIAQHHFPLGFLSMNILWLYLSCTWDFTLLPWAPGWTTAWQTSQCTADSVWPVGRSLWRRPAVVSGTTPTAAPPWWSGSGVAQTQMLPDTVYTHPRVSRPTAGTCNLHWENPGLPAQGNITPRPEESSGKQENAKNKKSQEQGMGFSCSWRGWGGSRGIVLIVTATLVSRGYREKEL